MPSRIRPHKSARKEVRRIARKRLRKAIESLQLPTRQRAKGIHQARKRLKEVRALLRLVRGPLGETYQVENRRLRDAARLLSDLRDQTARVEAWDGLLARNPRAIDPAAARAIRHRLQQHPASTEAGPASGNQAVGKALALIEQTERCIAQWPLGNKGFELFEKSLRKTLKDGCKALKLAEREPNAHNLHEWRKRVKDHWYQTRYLSLAWPALFESRAGQLKDLAQWLGDDHDLAMLQALQSEQPGLFGEDMLGVQVAHLIAGQRERLQQQALALGRLLYTESAGALSRRWKAYWVLAAEQPAPEAPSESAPAPLEPATSEKRE